jgi:hypothetical protein
MKVTQTHVWAAEIEDRPGGLAQVLAAIAGAGGSLECLIARRQPDRPGKGVVFVTPLKGKRVLSAAGASGFHETKRVATLKVEGMDRPGLGAQITRVVGEAGVSLRGVSAAALGRRFVCYLGFDSDADAAKAAAALKTLLRPKK